MLTYLSMYINQYRLKKSYKHICIENNRLFQQTKNNAAVVVVFFKFCTKNSNDENNNLNDKYM